MEQTFVVIKGPWVGAVGPEGLICVYSLTNSGDRLGLLENLSLFIEQWDCSNFALFGDFNAVLNLEERWSVHGFGSTSEEFVNLV